MAIYKNREVTVTEQPRAALPTNINVQHKNGMRETVPVSQVSFTEDEKNLLVKNSTNQYDNLKVIGDDDLKAVRAGVTPPSDPILKEQAKAKAQHQKQMDETKKNTDAAQKKAEEDLKKESQSPVSTHTSAIDPTKDVHNVSIPNQAKQ